MKMALIGGCMDGFSLDIYGALPTYLEFPRPEQAEPVEGDAFAIEFGTTDTYYLRRIKVGEVSCWMYVYGKLKMLDAVRLLLERYVNHEPEYASFVYASDNRACGCTWRERS